MDIERIVVHLMADASQYNRVMASSVTTLHTTVRQMAGMGPVFDASVKVPLLLAAGAVGAVTVAAGAAVYEGVRLAGAYEKAGIAFEVMTGSAERGKQMLEDINQLALTTPFRSTELVEGAKELKAFGVGTEQVLPVLEVLGDVSAGTGTSLGRLTLALGQVMTAGRLTGQELRQFVNAGVPLIEYLSRSMGKPEQAIQHMVRQGKVGANDVIEAFTRMTTEGGIFSDMMVRLNNTVPGQWNTLIENLEFLARDMGTAFFEGVRLKDLLKSANTWLSGGRDAMQGEGHGGWTEYFAQVRRNVEWLITQTRAFWDVFYDGLNLGGAAEGISGLYARIRGAFQSGEVDRFLADVRANLTDFFVVAQDRALIFWRTTVSAFRGLRDVVMDVYRQGTEWLDNNRDAVNSFGEQAAVAIALITTATVVWVTTTRLLIPVYTAVRAAVLAVGGAMAALNAVMYASRGVSLTWDMIGAAIRGALGFVAPTVVLAGFIAATGTLIAQWVDVGRTWKSVVSTGVALFRDLSDTLSTVWSGFSEAMRADNPELAWKIVAKGMELAWKQVLNAMSAEWKRFKSQELGGTWDEVRSGFRLMDNDFTTWVEKTKARLGYIPKNFWLQDSDKVGISKAQAELMKEIQDIEDKRQKKVGEILDEQGNRELVRRLRLEYELEQVRNNGTQGLRDQLKALQEQAKAEADKVREQKASEEVARRQLENQKLALKLAQESYTAMQAAMKEASRNVRLPQGMSPGAVQNYGVSPGMFAAGRFLGIDPRNLPGFLRPAPGTSQFNQLNPFGAAMGGAALPPSTPRAFPEKIFQVDPKVSEMADKINKMFEDGITEAEKLGTHIKRIFQARGLEQLPGGAAMGGAGAFMAGNPQISPEMAAMAAAEEFKSALNYVKDELTPKQPPTLAAGSAQAMDAINKANLQQQADNVQVIDVLKQANQKHDRQIAEAKRVADAMEKAAQQGVVLVPKKLEPRK